VAYGKPQSVPTNYSEHPRTPLGGRQRVTLLEFEGKGVVLSAVTIITREEKRLLEDSTKEGRLLS